MKNKAIMIPAKNVACIAPNSKETAVLSNRHEISESHEYATNQSVLTSHEI